MCSIPNSKYWIADIVAEKNTMNEQVAAVTCAKKRAASVKSEVIAKNAKIQEDDTKSMILFIS